MAVCLNELVRRTEQEEQKDRDYVYSCTAAIKNVQAKKEGLKKTPR